MERLHSNGTATLVTDRNLKWFETCDINDVEDSRLALQVCSVNVCVCVICGLISAFIFGATNRCRA